jgi:asparagine synthase (glutamine-hydrolysing)
MIHAMGRRGLEWSASWSDEFATLAQSGYDWEERSRCRSLASSERCVVAADTTLVYRHDLAKGLPSFGNGRHGCSDAHLILESYEVKGEECVKRLEGDFAFVLWDLREHRLLAARDFTGNRTLFYSTSGSRLIVASTVAGVLAEGSVDKTLDLDVLAAHSAMLWSHTNNTVFKNIRELPAGHVLSWSPGKPVHISRFWHPPSDFVDSRQSIDDASVELRDLLTAAVRERLSPSGDTAVTLSGGWDSSSVYGAAHNALEGSGEPDRKIRAISLSFPPGDPGPRTSSSPRSLASGEETSPGSTLRHCASLTI